MYIKHQRNIFRRTAIKELIGMTILKVDRDLVVVAKKKNVTFMPTWMLMNIYSKLIQVKIQDFYEKLDNLLIQIFNPMMVQMMTTMKLKCFVVKKSVFQILLAVHRMANHKMIMI